MKPKILSHKRPFLKNRKNFFSDTQYNRMVTGITKMKTGENRPKLIITTSIPATEMWGLIKSYYNRNKLENEFSTSVNKNNNELTIVFSQGQGGTRTWYLNDLTRLIAGGQIKSYSTTSPTTGVTEGGTAIKFSTVNNNPVYTATIANTNPAIINPTVDNPAPETPIIQPIVRGGILPPLEDSDETEVEDSVDNSKRNIIIIGGIVAVILLFIFMKKK